MIVLRPNRRAVAFLCSTIAISCGDGPCDDKPKCKGADDVSRYDRDDYHSITCVWYCKEGRYVSVEYVKDACGYDKESTYTSDGICN